MKHLLKKMVRPLWRISAPVRRPLIRKFDQHMAQLLRPLSPPPAPVPPPPPPAAPADLDLVLNSVVRELARLQVQVEVLQQQIDDLQSSNRDGARLESRLSVVAETG
jgi:hypothetical protein